MTIEIRVTAKIPSIRELIDISKACKIYPCKGKKDEALIYLELKDEVLEALKKLIKKYEQ